MSAETEEEKAEEEEIMTDTDRIKRLAEWMGWTWCPAGSAFWNDKSLKYERDWNPLTRDQDALMLADRAIEEEWEFRLESNRAAGQSPWHAFFWQRRKHLHGEGKTRSAAIVAAIEQLMEGTHDHD